MTSSYKQISNLKPPPFHNFTNPNRHHKSRKTGHHDRSEIPKNPTKNRKPHHHNRQPHVRMTILKGYRLSSTTTEWWGTAGFGGASIRPEREGDATSLTIVHWPTTIFFRGFFINKEPQEGRRKGPQESLVFLLVLGKSAPFSR